MHHYCPGVYSASNRNQYQVYLLALKAAGSWADNLTTFMCRMAGNSRSLNFLESCEGRGFILNAVCNLEM